MPTFAAYIEFDPDTKTYFGMIPSIPGAHTQGDTLEELRANLKEVLELCLEEYDGELPQFVGVLEIEVSDEAVH
jgi:predicted RNase H-like HicB family nuclease